MQKKKLLVPRTMLLLSCDYLCLEILLNGIVFFSSKIMAYIHFTWILWFPENYGIQTSPWSVIMHPKLKP